MSERKKPDWKVARTIVFAPPEKPHKVPHVQLQVLMPIRPEYSNLGRNEGSAPGGQADREGGHRQAWKEVAAQKLNEETGISVATPDDLIPVGKFENTTVNPEGKSFLTLSYVFFLELAEHPEQVILDKNQGWIGWLNVINDELQTQFRNENGQIVMEVTPAFNTRKMIDKALKLRKKLRGEN